MKKPKPPKSLEEVEAYIAEKGFCVDPIWFWNSFGVADWHDTNGKPILSWKQKLWNLDKLQRSWGGAHQCSICKKPGIYDGGKDRDGHPIYRCFEHKPKPKPLPKDLVPEMKKIEPEPEVDINAKRNKNKDLLGIR